MLQEAMYMWHMLACREGPTQTYLHETFVNEKSPPPSVQSQQNAAG